jgi:hypothetical protein
VKFRFGSPKPVRYSKFVDFLAFVISANDCIDDPLLNFVAPKYTSSYTSCVILS